MPQAHNLSAEDLARIQNLIDTGNYNGAWQELSRLGDSYADNAADVVGPPTSPAGEFFNELVKQHWDNAAGEGAYEEKFDNVAETHLNNYLDILSETDNWPNTKEIETSYREAVTNEGLPPETAFDGVFTKSFLGDDLSLNILDTGLGMEWEDFLNIESERIVESDVFDDIDRDAASSIIREDFIDTIQKFLEDGLEDGNFAPLLKIPSEWLQDEIGDFLNEAEGDFLDDLLDLSKKLDSFGDDVLQAIDDLFGWLPTPPRRRDPLTLDLNGDGIQITNLEEGVYFDQDANGIKNLSQWISPEDGFLVLDRNMNGSIDNGTELFGDNTSINAQGDTAANGYDALAVFDINADGKIDQNDNVYNELKVWVDKNSDGVSQYNELFTLADVGVSSISLNYDTNSLTSSYTDTQQVEHNTQSVLFDTSRYYREFTESLVISDSIKLLPSMTGTGTVRDLHEAATLSTALENDLTSFSTETIRANQMNLAESIVINWAKTSDTYAEYNEVIIGPTMDKLYIVESFAGARVPFSFTVGTNGGATQIPTGLIEESYDNIIKKTYLELTSQTTLKPYLDEILLGFDYTGITFDLSGIVTKLSSESLTVEVISNALDLTSVLSNITSSNVYPLIQFISDSIFALPEEDIALLVDILDFNDVIISATDGISEIFFETHNMKLIEGGLNNDSINGGEGNDYLYGGNGLDYIYGGNGDDVISGGADRDSLSGNSGEDIISGGEGNDSLFGGSDNDTLSGDEGNDKLEGGSGNDNLDGGSGTDYLVGNDGDDTLRGGTGNNDTLKGDKGNDTYLFGLGDGNTTIQNYDSSGADSYDVLRFLEGITASDISFSRVGENLNLTVGSTNEVINVERFFSSGIYSSNYTLDAIEFSDGTIWTAEELKLFAIKGTELSETLTGYDTNDVIDALEGNDYVHGNDGNDTLTGGSGLDYIYGGNGDDIISGGADRDSLSGNSGEDIISGGEGNDSLFGGSDNDTLSGDEGNDKLEGGSGNDNLDGGSGTDYLVGNDGDDTLRGGTGNNDTLKGDKGNDTYLFGLGDGNTTIQNYDSSGADSYDVLRLLEGITASDISFSRVGENLNLTVGSTNEVINVERFFSSGIYSSNYTLDAIELFDGTSFNMDQLGNITANTPPILASTLLQQSIDSTFNQLIQSYSSFNDDADETENNKINNDNFTILPAIENQF